jgi:PAS domain S-box-containing protein
MDKIDTAPNYVPDPTHTLAEGHEGLHLLVEAVSEYAIYLLDPAGRIMTWNSGAQRIKGYTESEILGQPFALFFTPEDIERAKPARILEIATREGKYQEEGWRVRKDGSRFWANALITAIYDRDGELRGFGKVTRDMTSARETQEALRLSEERFRLLVEGVKDYAIFMLDAGGHIVTWNSGAQVIKGYTAAEIIGRHFSIFYPPEDVQNGKPEWELRIAIMEGKYQEEGWRLRKDGSRFWANVLITALFDPQGELRGFGKVTRDMTERKLAEEQREQLRERERQLILEREERELMESAMRMRDMFMTVLAHELRTPLTSLLGNAQLLLRRGQREQSLSERDQRNVEVIISQAARLNEMVSLQLEISRLNTGQLHIARQPVDIAALARQVVEETQPTVTAHAVTYAGPDTPLLIEGDALRLFQVVQNLVQNAIKYSPTGGTVEVQVEPRDATAAIIVRDEGIGIPRAELPRLFQRFYRAANVEAHHISGLGVGLYVVKELVTLHGGTVQVESEEGQGSTFIIRLPLLAIEASARDALTV